MERLGPVDELFLELERSGPPLAVGSVSELTGEAPSLADVRAFVASRLVDMPRFRQRVEPSRTKVRSDKWVPAEPDLKHHIRGVELANGEGLDPTVSALMEQPLDRARPLWDMSVITGYSSDRWALVIRLHHAVADGQGATILLGHLIDLMPDGSYTLADAIAASMRRPGSGDDSSGSSGSTPLAAMPKKLRKSIEAGIGTLGQFISAYPDTLRALAQYMPRPPGDLTGQVSASRTWVSGHYPLGPVKRARKGYDDVTINDIVLAAVAHGFTQLLESRGEDPSGRTLRAVMPVTLRTDLSSNNQVGLLPAPLPLGEMPPAERLRRIHEATRHSKRSLTPKITDDLAKVTSKMTPSAIKDQVVGRSGSTMQLFAETLVTNVKGSDVPMYFMGVEVTSQTPIIPIEASMRIIIGITSYNGELNLGITGDGEEAADVDVLLAGILDGFGEIAAGAAVSSDTASDT